MNNVLAIKDDYKVISLASVMGLEATKSTSESNRFLFEIGVFDPKMVRRGAKEIKFNTNSASQLKSYFSRSCLIRNGIY
ncbi:phenylalanine--tRNA ligase beta subunit-related protein [Mycoplasmopsis cynos]|uniref:phenylalanine--tRNA ligase beta subunit-related protein n=1 Tax=Mycoplasmopsis cynos TaxID=171284 RepID=UPI00220303D1|nr:phenylalanine--tRNA ligase beta subunit-related protein [Mycoplasmopsis cynos]UWV82816.1 phenylalanine--tRNA ligase beta subunit-related protein [Mycoplasmopsis cynos]